MSCLCVQTVEMKVKRNCDNCERTPSKVLFSLCFLFFLPGLGIRTFHSNKLFPKDNLSSVAFFQNREKTVHKSSLFIQSGANWGAANSTRIFLVITLTADLSKIQIFVHNITKFSADQLCISRVLCILPFLLP